MQSLNELEKAVLAEIVRRTSDDARPLLKQQVEGAEVMSRENTGAGFYTELKAGRISMPIRPSPIGNVWANIKGFDQPMTFLVFLRDGFIHKLEGAAINDSTVGVDFSNVRFTILPV